MIPLRLTELADVVGGELVVEDEASRTVDAVTIDSRTTQPGALFVPLQGEHADGHDFIGDAVAGGAAGYLIAADRLALVAGEAPLPPGAVVVDDTADALLGLGAWLRDHVDPVTVAITGSQGKTTTKDLIAVAVAAPPLDGAGRPLHVAAAPGSYNNDLGVPLTCCLLDADSDVLVTEIGTRGIGHIARLAAVVRPTIAVVTAVGSSHLELLGDIDTVGRAKAELVEALDSSGVAVLNADDVRVAAMADRAPGRVVTYGLSEEADWQAVNIELDHLSRPRFTAVAPGGEHVRVALPLLGRHNVHNALAAIAVASECGVTARAAAAALADARVSRWRMELHERADGVVIINDAYNANPASTAAALAALENLQVSRRWAVLGLMAELGASSAAAHADVGRTCAESGLDGLIVVGENARGIHDAALDAGLGEEALLALVRDAHEAVDLLRRQLRSGDAVLVKASRSVGLERVAGALTDEDALR